MDMGTSVLSRLHNKSKETGKPLQSHLMLFCQEEFLRRLAASPYSGNLVLKGGLLIYSLTNFDSRATVDIDFLIKRMPSGLEDIIAIVDAIIATDTGNDFVTFTARGFETISPQRKYSGFSFQLIGRIKNTRTPFSVDLGIGDIVVPSPQKRQIPVQLDGFNAPTVLTYSLESTIAEKLDALLQRMELTSRMKDIYDIYYLSQHFEFEGRLLQRAISETLGNRGTYFQGDSLNRIVALAQDKDIQLRWRQFLRRIKSSEMKLDPVMDCIDAFIRPVWEAMISNDEMRTIWNCTLGRWK